MEIEAQARSEGWVSKEEWKGKPEEWVDAEKFVERGKTWLSEQADKNRRLVEEVDTLKGEMAELRAASVEFKAIADKSIEKSKQERDQAISQLEKVKEQAITDGDGAKAVRAEKDIKRLEAETVAESRETLQERWKERAIQWAKDNPWYVRNSSDYNEEKRIWADGLSDVITAELPHLQNDPTAYFKELSRRIDVKFEETNENRQREEVETKGGGKPKKGGKSFDALPEEAKQGYQSMKTLFPKLTEEDYLKNYTWD